MPVKYRYSHIPNLSHHVQGGYQAKNNNIIEYLDLVKEWMKWFDWTKIKHVPREQNTRADILSKLASTKKKGGNKSVIQESLSRPRIEKFAAPPEVNAIGDDSCWMTRVFNFLTVGVFTADKREATVTKR